MVEVEGKAELTGTARHAACPSVLPTAPFTEHKAFDDNTRRHSQEASGRSARKSTVQVGDLI